MTEADSSRPGPNARWTSIAAPMILLVKVSGSLSVASVLSSELAKRVVKYFFELRPMTQQSRQIFSILQFSCVYFTRIISQIVRERFGNYYKIETKYAEQTYVACGQNPVKKAWLN